MGSICPTIILYTENIIYVHDVHDVHDVRTGLLTGLLASEDANENQIGESHLFPSVGR